MAGRLRVLILEDNVPDAELVIYELRKAGFNLDCQVVTTESDYLTRLDATLDLIIADYSLPQFNALHALYLLQERALDIPFIIVTGAVGEEVVVECMKQGATDYLLKDRLARLGSAVTHALEQKHVREERRRAEELLTVSEEKYRSIYENAIEGIYQSTPEGRYLSVNPAFARMHGFASPEELITTVTDIEHQIYVHPEDHVRFKKTLEEQGYVHDLEIELYRKDGSVIWTRGNARVVRSEDGGILYYEGTKEDITERKRLEGQLLQSQKMEAIGRLAGGVAHDFNNLLTVIMGNAEIMLYKIQPDDPFHPRLMAIKETTERAAHLTGQLLAFSRKQIVEPKILNMNDVLKRLAKGLIRLLGEDIDCQYNLCPGIKPVKADPGQIDQILLNVIVNAADAMPKGGKLLISTENYSCGKEYDPGNPNLAPGDYTLISVSDSGAGVSPEIKEQIFEPFFTTKKGGSGLGLSIVYGIVTQYGGHVSVQSEVGKGTTFNIYLPAYEQEKELPGIDLSFERAMPAGDETVLVVEDEPMILTLLTDTLEQLGYSVFPVSTAEAAISKAQEQKGLIDLVVSDVILADKRGTDLVDMLKTTYPHMEALFISGYSDDRIASADIADGKVHFLSKPFTPSALARKIREVMKNRSR